MATIHFIDSPNYLDTSTPAGSELFNNAIPVFLVGPILGTWEWQEYAKNRLQYLADQDDSDMSILVYNPRQQKFTDLKDFTDDTFYDQVDWEHTHLQWAKLRGVKFAWLANKTVDSKRNYCLTTLFELGELIGEPGQPRHAVVGIEPGFTNEKYLQYTIDKKAPEVKVTNDLDHACDLVMAMLLSLHQQ